MLDLNYERTLITVIMNIISEKCRLRVEDVIYPEDQRPIPENPVDAVYNTTKGYYIFEHTKIESYGGQITEDFKISDLLPLEKELEKHITNPGRYELNVAPKTTLSLKVNAKTFKRISDWVLSVAPQLEIGSPSTVPRHRICAYLDELKLELCLYRWPSNDINVKVGRFTPENTERDLLDQMNRSLQRKLPKLDIWRKKLNGIGILVLESIDVALVNSSSIAEAFFQIVKNNECQPDLLFVAQTHLNTGEIWQFLKPFEFANSEFEGNFDL